MYKVLNIKNIMAMLLVAVVGLLMTNCGGSDDSGSSTTTPTPTITFTGAITVFPNTNELSHSASQSVQVNGSNLTGDITIAASTNFEVSLDDVTFSNNIILTGASANSSATALYVRFSPLSGSIGNQIGTIVLSSASAANKTINVSGVGVSIAPIINTDVTTLAFDDTQMNVISSPLSIVINGDNLVSDINLTTSANFEVSLDNTTFSTTTIIPSSSVNDDTTVYVRFLPTAVTNYTGTLTLQNTDASDVTISLTGNGTPVVHNYVTFNSQSLGFGGGFNQSASQTFTLHNDLSNIAQIKMYLTIDCPSTGCDDWDRFANIKVKEQSSGDWFEIGRYITPYWTGTQQLARGLEFDVTDFKSLLTGSTELRIYIENWTSKADIITVDFDFIEGTPDYPNYAVARVMDYSDNSIAGVPYGSDASAFDLDKTVTIPANSESTHLRTIISGWGHATPADAGGRACAEWCYRTHQIKINGNNAFDHYMGPIGCSSNPISNQSPGNWTPDRAGWCPGMAVPTRIDEFATAMGGNTFTYEYDYENWTNDGANGNAFYATSTYVVVKSNSTIVKPTVID